MKFKEGDLIIIDELDEWSGFRKVKDYFIGKSFVLKCTSAYGNTVIFLTNDDRVFLQSKGLDFEVYGDNSIEIAIRKFRLAMDERE
jgi:hypothetical protein